MRVIEATRRSGVAIASDRTIRAAAQIMEQAGVGALVIVNAEQNVVGIVTDRDLVRRVLAPGLALDGRVDGVMTSPVVTIEAQADLHDAFESFGSHRVRRLPIVQDDRFLGMITVDDMLIELTADLSGLIRPIRSEVLTAHHDSPVPAKA